MRLVLFLFLLISTFCPGQNTWPKNYQETKINPLEIYPDDDGGYLIMAEINNQGYAYLLKFDANANLIWRKCIYNSKSPVVGHQFFKDALKNLYIVGMALDKDTLGGNGFILRLDSCYKKVACALYGDSNTIGQEFFAWNGDINDSLFYVTGSEFDPSFNQFLTINKGTLTPASVYNSRGYSEYFNSCTSGNSLYIPMFDQYYLKGGDTTLLGSRTCVLKLNRQSANFTFYKFLGFDENIISQGVSIYKNNADHLFVFSVFLDKAGDTTNQRYSPMLFECDTNGHLIRYKIYTDKSVNQILSNTLQFNDSTYFMVATYLDWGQSGFDPEKIKFYKLDGMGNIKDSFYMNNWGRRFFTLAGVTQISLMKTTDNKIMCCFQEVDSNFTYPRLTFIQFDQNFNLDTTEYRYKKYDGGCGVGNDSINIASAQFFQLHSDNSFPILKLSKPDGVIKVAKEYKLSFYPNPIVSDAKFEFENVPGGELRIELYDSKGGLVKEMSYDKLIIKGNCNISLNFASISSGQYYIRVMFNNDIKHTIKVIKE